MAYFPNRDHFVGQTALELFNLKGIFLSRSPVFVKLWLRTLFFFNACWCNTLFYPSIHLLAC